MDKKRGVSHMFGPWTLDKDIHVLKKACLIVFLTPAEDQNGLEWTRTTKKVPN